MRFTKLAVLLLALLLLAAACSKVDELLDDALDDGAGSSTTTTVAITTTTGSGIEFWGPQITNATVGRIRPPVFVVDIPTGMAVIDLDGVRLGWMPGADLVSISTSLLAEEARRREPVSGADLLANGVVTDPITGATTVDGVEAFDLLPGEVMAATDDYRFISRFDPINSPVSIVYDRLSGEQTPLVDRCIVSDVSGGSWYVLCDSLLYPDERQAEVRARHFDGTIETLGGPGYGPFEDAPEGLEIIGRWLWVETGPEGRVLAQWSGECDIPSAHIIFAGSVRSLYLENEMPVLLANEDPRTEGLETPESTALGWLPDGRAAVVIRSGHCSIPAPDGIYAIDPATGDVEQLLATVRDARLLVR